ncbi:MAG: bifunctional 4-hydroxy-2-oxoglutarate aldolase/2-dehydro-3-deoxy-phosphogluconate aldolase [Planctomycetota bacterium]
MSDRQAGVDRLTRKGIVAVVRASSGEQMGEVVDALLEGGVDCIEITMTTPNALEIISESRKRYGEDAYIGVGSVCDGETATKAVDAGAEFVVGPMFNPDVLQTAHDANLPCIPGAFTPTEMYSAYAAGADMVKVFPAGMHGPKFFKAVLAPMPFLKLTPTGGVNLETAADWIAAGAKTLGVGSALVTKSALASRQYSEIQELASRYIDIVAEARNQFGE